MKALGAQAVPQRSVAAPAGAMRPLAGPAPASALPAGAGNFAQLRALGLRAQLAVSRPDDPDEREADRAADAFVQQPAAGPPVRRSCASCDDDLVRRDASGPAPAAAAAISRTGGRPLAPVERAPYERFFAADLGRVRVHDDDASAEAARALNANAFARGPDLFFARGRFDPASDGGRRLLAHELTHVLQPAPAARVARDEDEAPPVEVWLDEDMPWVARTSVHASEAQVAQVLYGQTAALPQTRTDPVEQGIGWVAKQLGRDFQPSRRRFDITPQLLVEPYRHQFFSRMEELLSADVEAIESTLLETFIDKKDQNRLIDAVQAWSRRRDLRDESGRSYFDRFLGRLKTDQWVTDYGVATSEGKPFLDKLYTEAGPHVVELNTLIGTRSREFGAYRPAWARLESTASLALGDEAEPEVDPDFVARTSDLLADRIAGATDKGDSKEIVGLLEDLPPAAQAQVLNHLMKRHGESDVTGVFGRFGERWGGGMLYDLFEDLTDRDRANLADALRKSGVLAPNVIDSLVAGRGWGGKYLPYTTHLAQESAEWYADECEWGEGASSSAACVGLGFSVLWLPETAGATALTLGTAGLGGALAQAPAVVRNIALLGGTGLASYTGTTALIELVTGKTADGQVLDETDKWVRGITVVSSALFVAAGFLSVPRAAPTGLQVRAPQAIDPAAPGGGAAGEGGVQMRIVSENPATGDVTVAGLDSASGEVAILRVNLKTGNGTIQLGGEVRTIAGFQMQPGRPLLGPGSAAPPTEPVVDPAALPATAPKTLSPGTPAAATPTLPRRVSVGPQDIAQIRSTYGLPPDADTVAAGATDVPGIQGMRFAAASPQVRAAATTPLPEPTPHIVSPRNNPQFVEHAEQGLANQFIDAVEAAGLDPAALEGRTFAMHISEATGVCGACKAGLADAQVAPGPLRQLSERYPGLTIRITWTDSAGQARALVIVDGEILFRL